MEREEALERLKKKRTILRTSLSKYGKRIEEYDVHKECDHEELLGQLSDVYEELRRVDEEIGKLIDIKDLEKDLKMVMNLMLEDEAISPPDLEKEQDMVVQYEESFVRTELRVAKYLQVRENGQQGRGTLDPARSAQEGEGEVGPYRVYNIRVNYEENLDNVLRRFWEVEKVPLRHAKPDADEFCEELYKTRVREEHVPPAKWMMGRVAEIHPGRDGLVRVGSIRTKAGILKRPLVKLALLPVPHSLL
ncbi:hypothetical protein LAZ67_2001238 [Cordylochernes scorpioides]|uniref:DUF5641 domain-containing protein n=1 Tax=Cordylochernes scorpioides TaxID=51811 RepID=A0ABY6K1Y6_9ARAC|nr:hypothetical protein LAZ67_2001238 [Cordylochernes scorpioides]